VRPKLQRSREQYLAELAEAVVDYHSPNSPTDLIRILRENEIGFNFGHYRESFDGLIDFSKQRPFIFINLDRGNYPSAGRGRFTVGHELGHFFIDEHRRVLESGRAPSHGSRCGLFDSQNSIEELEADFFAANVLMPPSRFLPMLQKRMFKGVANAIVQLKEIFQTSITGAALQFTRLSPKPCAVLKWNSEKLEWGRFSPLWEYGDELRFRFAKSLFVADLPATNCATAAALISGADRIQGPTTATAAFYFSGVNPGATNDIILNEEAISLGEYGAISLLTARAF
jgi:Zn-dependent peptidase ImmA (M78 family)